MYVCIHDHFLSIHSKAHYRKKTYYALFPFSLFCTSANKLFVTLISYVDCLLKLLRLKLFRTASGLRKTKVYKRI
ncbi:unnamed protein product [Leptidea sinapis]|uniref:Uncharacterized protein n=1 Tax=Leptidea sinapis TaxID=189913 RepID=A0A5E4R7Y5_9NEOP|nr:unnamed protein product [Leptidea sinapis]